MALLTQPSGNSGIAKIDTNDVPQSSTSVPCILLLASGQVLIVFNTLADAQTRNVVVRVPPDDPPAGTVRFDNSDLKLSATALTLELVIHRAGGSEGAVSVHYETFDSSGLGGVDYNAAAGRLDWPDGDVSDRHLTLSLPRSAQAKGSHWDFYVRLSLTQGEAAAENMTSHVVFSGVVSPPPPVVLPPPADSAAAPSGGGGALDPADLTFLTLIVAAGSLAPLFKRRRRTKLQISALPSGINAGSTRQRLHSLTILAALLASGFGTVPPAPPVQCVASQRTAPAPIPAAIAAYAATHTIYIGNFGKLGVLKSTDGGAHFTPANNGSEFPDVGAMVMVNNDPNTVYVGGGSGIVYKTLSGGVA